MSDARRKKLVCGYVSKYRKNRRAKLDEFKKGKPCQDCGNVFPTECMDFDHREPTQKLFQIGQHHASFSWEKVLKEIEKCDLICANCHRIRTTRKCRLG